MASLYFFAGKEEEEEGEGKVNGLGDSHVWEDKEDEGGDRFFGDLLCPKKQTSNNKFTRFV